ncbi:CDP-diacylglycerol--glycerol-3-phosphate 3-phosphatidyltransferase [Arsenicitalea aurantiaca]|uniref:CDP-diacylglycerol--glycerol-3-phosphate 3-phosphatidyltransferase n=1 Tax=Arsenicitalea aurantiaca TaxID=1783274 RepID=A0A433XLM1_9HYPH|nr:CDP-diacylglycerol--glycerol-3-phosphate 3-phosphatidyltransferase [Arsenicitalea aurantiaca]RUT34975.1 CDP-diacylglycerol--glycerol-3-phosphate 3-phosphatidyltransferase [Arsenicitalea aurantiaca]
MARSSQLTLPNVITVARILTIPVIVWMLVTGDPGLRAAAMVLFIIAAASDWVDGYLARRLNQTSALGRMLDPIADKLLVGALLLTLCWDGSFSAWDLVAANLILAREIFISGLREFLGARNVTVHVTALAKWKTTAQLVAIVVVLLEPLMAGLDLVSALILWIAALLTVVTGAQYFAGAWRHFEEERP